MKNSDKTKKFKSDLKSKVVLMTLIFFQATFLLIGQTSIPAQPSAITGPNKVCSGSSNIVYSVDPSSQTASYLWTLPLGVSGISTTNSISLNFSSTFTGGSICVSAVNSAGTSPARCLQISKLSKAPARPNTITQICQGTTRTFSISPVNNATSYNWVVPNNSQILSGQGTTSIVAQIGSNSGNVSVSAVNCIGSSSTRSLSLSSTTISSPSQITGNINAACPGSTQTFTCSLISGISSYNWTAPANSSIVSGNGSNAVTIAFGNNFTSGNLSVVATNGCSNSSPRTVLLRSVPGYPPTIQGQIDNLCGGGTFTYTATPVIGATGYNWIVPEDCQIVSQTNNSITLNIPSNFISGNLRVSAFNSCGQGPSFLKILTRLPNLSTAPIGPTTVCSNSPIATYSVNVPQGCTISWITGVPILSQTANSITVDFSGSASTTVIYAYAVNACGSSAGRNTDIQVVNCAREAENNDILITDEFNQEISVFPNPSSGIFNLNISSQYGNNHIQVFSLTGQIIMDYYINQSSNNLELNLQDLQNGIYIVKVTNSEKETFQKLIKN